MAVSRRRFLHDGVFAAAACLAAPMAGWAAGPPMRGAPVAKKGPPSSTNSAAGQFTGLGDIERQGFVDAIGSPFKISYGGAAPVWMRLLAVSDFATPPPFNPASMAVMPPKSNTRPVVTAGYYLSFSGTGSEHLPQGTHTFDHPQLGQFALFVVPGTGPQQSCLAVINQLPLASVVDLSVGNSVSATSGRQVPGGSGRSLAPAGGFTPAPGAAPQAASSPSTGAPATEPTPETRSPGGFRQGRDLVY
ncbi:MAG TPA: hypothetical protein VNW97_18725 [Candidatus Saccharimonadales bacterium]|jgi:hypothetical protein|nr:hypothetical protein [Candidatus Saccharimonadales bacterium]